MSSRVLLLLGLLLAIGLVISSEVAAKKTLVDVSTSTEKKDDATTGTTTQNPETVGEYSTEGGVGGVGAADSYGGRCRYGCCRWRGPYGCSMCCQYAGQAVDADQTQAKPGN